MFKKQWLAVAVLVIATSSLSIYSCSDDDPINSPLTPLPPELVGVRTLTSWTLNGQAQPLNDLFEDQSTAYGTLTINSNRSYSAEEFDVSGNITYSDSGSLTVSGSQFTLTTTMVNGSPITPETVVGTWEVSGHILLMTQVDGQNTIVITFRTAPSGP